MIFSRTGHAWSDAAQLRNVPGEQDAWHKDELEMIRLLHHLPAPWDGAIPIRYERFSLFTTKPQDCGLDLVPSRVYRHIYPLTTAQLREQADMFENLRPEGINGGRAPPRMDQLREYLDEWRKLCYEIRGERSSKTPLEQPPEFRMTQDDQGEIILDDTRPCAIPSQWQLTRLAAEVYRLCDAGAALSAITTKVRENGYPAATAAQVSQALSDPMRAKTLLQVSGRYLSLAVQWPYRPCQSMDLPGSGRRCGLILTTVKARYVPSGPD